MGQYHKFVNFDKKEFITPHKFGNGLKLWEQVGWESSFSNVVHFLLAKCSGRGGGDFQSQMAGRWGGDRVSLVGDYAEWADFPFLSISEFKSMMKAVWGSDEDTLEVTVELHPRDSKGRFAKKVHLSKSGFLSARQGWKDVSDVVAKAFAKEFEIEYTGDGWKHIVSAENNKEVSPSMRPDFVVTTR